MRRALLSDTERTSPNSGSVHPASSACPMPSRRMLAATAVRAFVLRARALRSVGSSFRAASRYRPGFYDSHLHLLRAERL